MSADPPVDPPLDPPPDSPADLPVAATPSPEDPAHDPFGADLARAVARSYRGVNRDRAKRRGRGTGRRPRGVGPQVSGAGPDDRDPQAIGNALSRLAAEHGWTADLAVHGVFGRWETIVGSEVSAHCRPERFVDGRLVVRADSTAWATQMRMLVPLVVRRLDDDLGSGTVTRIEVLGPDQPSWRHGRFSLRGTRGPRDTYG